MCDLLNFSTANTFASSMGRFAKPHSDKNDAGAALSAMTVLLSIPEYYVPGTFAYHDFMVLIVPTNPSIVYFTGLHTHGGTTPFPPPGRPSLPWAYRLSIVCYLNGPIMGGDSRNSLVPFRGFDIVKRNPNENKNPEDILKIPPEICFRQRYAPPCRRHLRLTYCQHRPDCMKANLARDGPSLQGPQAHLTTFSRETALLVDHAFATLSNQYPDHELNIDYKTLLSSISMTRRATNGEGHDVVIRPIPWENAPAVDGSTDAFNEHLETCRKFLEDFAMHTPYYFLKHDPNPTPDQDSGSDGDVPSDRVPEVTDDAPDGKGKGTRGKKRKVREKGKAG